MLLRLKFLVVAAAYAVPWAPAHQAQVYGECSWGSSCKKSVMWESRCYYSERAPPFPIHSCTTCPCCSLHPRGVSRANSISGHGRCSARYPCRNQPPKCVNGQKGEAKAAKSKNGHAGWNPGAARPVRDGANQNAFQEGVLVYLPEKIALAPSNTLSYI